MSEKRPLDIARERLDAFREEITDEELTPEIALGVLGIETSLALAGELRFNSKISLDLMELEMAKLGWSVKEIEGKLKEYRHITRQ